MNDRAVIVLSGGQDSATTLAVAAVEAHPVAAVTFKYGQRHEREIEYARRWAARFDVAHRIITLPLTGSALIEGGDLSEVRNGLPASFVPARNLIMLTTAASIAYELDASLIYTGANQTDFSGYPDCRRDTLDALEHALTLGLERRMKIVTPLIDMTKADTFAVAFDLGVLEHVIRDTLTCYEGVETLNEWGRGCGACAACNLRKRGFDDFTSTPAP